VGSGIRRFDAVMRDHRGKFKTNPRSFSLKLLRTSMFFIYIYIYSDVRWHSVVISLCRRKDCAVGEIYYARSAYFRNLHLPIHMAIRPDYRFVFYQM
jgi:hypothetical protein